MSCICYAFESSLVEMIFSSTFMSHFFTGRFFYTLFVSTSTLKLIFKIILFSTIFYMVISINSNSLRLGHNNICVTHSALKLDYVNMSVMVPKPTMKVIQRTGILMPASTCLCLYLHIPAHRMRKWNKS